jgi:hypothetical protein
MNLEEHVAASGAAEAGRTARSSRRPGGLPTGWRLGNPTKRAGRRGNWPGEHFRPSSWCLWAVCRKGPASGTSACPPSKGKRQRRAPSCMADQRGQIVRWPGR